MKKENAEGADKNFNKWLDDYCEGGLHFEGLDQFETAQSVWAVMDDKIEQLKNEMKINDLENVDEEILFMFYNLDFDEGMSHAEFFDAYKAGFERGKKVRHFKMLEILTEIDNDLKNKYEYSSIGKGSIMHERIKELLK